MIGLLFHFLDEFLFLMCDDPYFIVKVLEIKRINKFGLLNNFWINFYIYLELCSKIDSDC